LREKIAFDIIFSSDFKVFNEKAKDNLLKLLFNFLYNQSHCIFYLMEFKDRFKGRTTIVTKEGVLNTLAAPSNNPVHKSQSNALINPQNHPKVPIPFPQSDNPCKSPYIHYLT